MNVYTIIGGCIGVIVGLIVGWLSQKAQSQKQLDLLRERTSQAEALLATTRHKLIAADLAARRAGRQAQQAEPAAPPPIQPVQAESDQSTHIEYLEDQVATLEAQSVAAKARIAQLEDDIVHARQRAAAAEAHIRQTLAEAHAARSQEDAGQAQLEQAAKRIFELEREVENARAEARQSRAETEQLEKDLAGMMQRTSLEANTALRARQLEEMWRETSAQATAAKLERDAARARVEQLEAELTVARQRIAEFIDQLEQCTTHEASPENIEPETSQESIAFAAAPETQAATEPEPFAAPVETVEGYAELAPIEALEEFARSETIEPVETEPVEFAPAEPVKAAPIEIEPAEPVEAEPIETAPIEFEQPVKAAPIEAEPLEQSEPVKAEPVPTAPVEASPEPPAVSPEKTLEAYCVKCKTKRPMLNPQETLVANTRPAIKGVCPECGATLFRFVKK